MAETWIEDRMRQVLEERRKRGLTRRLRAAGLDTVTNIPIDFSSNDYLGLAQDPEQLKIVVGESHNESRPLLGATGSRLISGDSEKFHQLEDYLARTHQRPAAFLCNSGYDANLSVVSTLLCTDIVYDEYIHNSLHMGIRLWKGQSGRQATTLNSTSFKHNDVQSLQNVLQNCACSAGSPKTIVVLVESVYSMDGDVAPVRQMLDVCHRYQALLVVDEAHGLGVLGRDRRPGAEPGTGLLAMEEVEQHPALLCSVHTFGKAAGCHGAVVCGSKLLKEYLVNYAYPLIYSTALPPHSLITIRCAYQTITGIKGDRLRQRVHELVDMFRSMLTSFLVTHVRQSIYLLPSTTPIQALVVPGNDLCSRFCQQLYEASRSRILLYPIKAPTVPAGQERIRIIIHAHNSDTEIIELVQLIKSTLTAMGLRKGSIKSKL